MAKIYYRRYKERIEAGELTLDEAIALARVEVPAKWRQAVIDLLEADRPVDPEPETQIGEGEEGTAEGETEDEADGGDGR